MFPHGRKVVLLGKSKNVYLLDDEFGDTRAAGAVNGTNATPTGGARTVIDTNNKISIGTSLLNFATGAVINDGVWYSSQTRTTGRLLLARINLSDTNGIAAIGWDTNQTGAINDALQFAAAGVIKIVPNGGTAINVGTYTATSYVVASIMRGTGMYWFIKGGAFTNFSLLWQTAAGSAAGFPGVQAGSITSVFTVG